ncbi:hypothetical protein Aduo_013846 [Ancylostoma duodenale]
MAKLNLIALAIASLLPALCEGKPVFFIQPLCPSGYLDKDTIENKVLKPINTHRLALAQGTQKNGSGGKPPKLPPATNMTKISWSCDLEQKAIKTINGNCVNQASPVKPNNGEGLADVLYYGIDYDNTVGAIIQDSFKDWLLKIKFNSFPVTTKGTVISYPTYDATNPILWPYANLVRATNTEIGCVLERCPPTSTVPNKLITFYCVLNGRNITNGEPLYMGTTKNTDGCKEVTCPTGYACNDATLLCERSATTSSSTSASTSSSTASSTGASGATTTKAPSPQAQFPTGGGSGGMCSGYANANRMTDNLRNEYVRLHNFRRGLLAKGEIPQKGDIYMPKAANMWKMSYDCGLEQGAIEYASQCPTAGSGQSSRPGVGENFKTFPSARFPTFEDAAKKSVTEWWKPIRSEAYFSSTNVNFLPIYDQYPISSFTRMAWATTNKVGCSLVKCTSNNVYVGVCRYRPMGNILNSNIYQIGNPCTVKPTGPTPLPSRCDSIEGLWY